MLQFRKYPRKLIGSRMESVIAVVRSCRALVENGTGNPRGRVDTAIPKHRILPTLETRVWLSVLAEGTAIQGAEALGSVSLHGKFVMVLQIGANTGEIFHDFDAELAELVRWSDPAQFQ